MILHCVCLHVRVVCHCICAYIGVCCIYGVYVWLCLYLHTLVCGMYGVCWHVVYVCRVWFLPTCTYLSQQQVYLNQAWTPAVIRIFSVLA